MKNNSILRGHIALLLLEYGKNSVLRSLAELIEQEPYDLEKILDNINKVKTTQTKQTPVAKSFISINSVLEKHPEKASLVRSLMDRYDNRTLLPELKDVRRFLEKHSQTPKSLKSRVDAAPKIIRVLIELPLQELEAMLSNPPNKEFSDLGIISDQILSRD